MQHYIEVVVCQRRVLKATRRGAGFAVPLIDTPQYLSQDLGKLDVLDGEQVGGIRPFGLARMLPVQRQILVVDGKRQWHMLIHVQIWRAA